MQHPTQLLQSPYTWGLPFIHPATGLNEQWWINFFGRGPSMPRTGASPQTSSPPESKCVWVGGVGQGPPTPSCLPNFFLSFLSWCCHWLKQSEPPLHTPPHTFTIPVSLFCSNVACNVPNCTNKYKQECHFPNPRQVVTFWSLLRLLDLASCCCSPPSLSPFVPPPLTPSKLHSVAQNFVNGQQEPPPHPSFPAPINTHTHTCKPARPG